MTLAIVRLLPEAAQSLSVALEGQACAITIYARSTGLYVDLSVQGRPIVTGVVARNLVRIVRSGWFGFQGDLFFNDTQGSDDPAIYGLGDRFVLIYDDGAAA